MSKGIAQSKAEDQVKHTTDWGIGIHTGANIFSNEFSYDKSHFSFTKPVTMGFSVIGNTKLNDNYSLMSKLYYTNKKINIEYNLNEPDIPANGQDNIYYKYDAFGLALDLRRYFHLKKLSIYTSVGLFYDYNINSETGLRSHVSGTDATDTSVVSSISSLIDNFGETKGVFGTGINAGFVFGKKHKSELNFFAQIPFGKLQKSPFIVDNRWHYNNQDYVHTMNARGYLYYCGIAYSYYIFKTM